MEHKTWQMRLNLRGQHTPYRVLLSADFFEYLKDRDNRLLAPLDLLKLFKSSPVGWDYCLFLLHRCARASSPSMVPHEVLISLFKEGKNEPDRITFRRLSQYHKQITAATQGRLKARHEPVGTFPGKGRGRRRKRWGLRMNPGGALLPHHTKKKRLAVFPQW